MEGLQELLDSRALTNVLLLLILIIVVKLERTYYK